jgi:6,7-dimethyl-8-ribityllumazine synthase
MPLMMPQTTSLGVGLDLNSLRARHQATSAGGAVKIAIVRALWNDPATSADTASIQKVLKEQNAGSSIYEVVGAFEIPYVVQRLQKNAAFNAIIAVGCYLSDQSAQVTTVSNALMQLNLANDSTACPVINCILQEHDLEGAIKKSQETGEQMAYAALQQVKLTSSL